MLVQPPIHFVGLKSNDTSYCLGSSGMVVTIVLRMRGVSLLGNSVKGSLSTGKSRNKIQVFVHRIILLFKGRAKYLSSAHLLTTYLVHVISPGSTFAVLAVGCFSIFLVPCTTSHTRTPSTILHSENVKTFRLRSLITQINGVVTACITSFQSCIFPFQRRNSTISCIFPTAKGFVQWCCLSFYF